MNSPSRFILTGLVLAVGLPMSGCRDDRANVGNEWSGQEKDGSATGTGGASIGTGGAPSDAGGEDSGEVDGGPCGLAVLCARGTLWSSTLCRCVECTSDADCRLERNYCEVCSCLALGADETIPLCSGNVVPCAIDPCMAKSAACINDTCVAR